MRRHLSAFTPATSPTRRAPNAPSAPAHTSSNGGGWRRQRPHGAGRIVVLVLAVLSALVVSTPSSAATPNSAAAPQAAQAGAGTSFTFEDVSHIDGLTDGHARVFRLYWAFFDREPDAGGALFWANRFNRCQTLQQIAAFFASSDEFVATYGSLTDAEFVDLIYRNVLDRVAEPGGRAFWEGEISSGRRTRVQVMLDFAYSDEFVAAHPLPSDGVPDQPCDPTAADVPAPGFDGAILRSTVAFAVLPTGLCGGAVTNANNVLSDGQTAPSSEAGFVGVYGRIRANSGVGPFQGSVFGDMDGNGVGDAAFILECLDDGGDLLGSHLIVLHDTGPAYTFEVQDVSVLAPIGGTAAGLVGVAYRGPNIEVSWKALGPRDPFCCPSITVYSGYFVADGGFTLANVFVDGPDAIARLIAQAANDDEYAPVMERITQAEFVDLASFAAPRGGLDFAGTPECILGALGYSCLVNVPDWGQIGFIMNFEDDIWKVDDILYDI